MNAARLTTGEVAFPSLSQIARVIKAAEKAGVEVGGVRVTPDGDIVVFASEAPLVDLRSSPGDNEPNDFD